MSEIADALVNAYVTFLTAELIDNVDVADPSRASLVRGGKLQANPVEAELYVLLHIGDPTDQKWRMTRPTWGDLTDADDSISNFLAQEIGGGGASNVAMTAQVEYFALTDAVDRDAARAAGRKLMGRTKNAIRKSGVDRSAGILGLKDEFGEVAIKVDLIDEFMDEDGGPDTSFIWRGYIRFTVTTMHNY